MVDLKKEPSPRPDEGAGFDFSHLEKVTKGEKPETSSSKPNDFRDQKIVEIRTPETESAGPLIEPETGLAPGGPEIKTAPIGGTIEPITSKSPILNMKPEKIGNGARLERVLNGLRSGGNDHAAKMAEAAKHHGEHEEQKNIAA